MKRTLMIKYHLFIIVLQYVVHAKDNISFDFFVSMFRKLRIEFLSIISLVYSAS